MKSFIKKLAIVGSTLAFAAAILVSFGTATPAQATSCVDGKQYTDFKGSYSGRDTMTVETKNGGKLCNDVKVNFASFVAPANYNGKGFSKNPTAIPQSQFYNKTVTLKKGTTGKTTVTVQVPDACTNYQIDAYLGAVQTKITTSEGFIGTNAIVGKLFQKLKDDCSVPKVQTCNTLTGAIVMVEKGKENTAPYSTDLEKCQKVTVCDTSTGAIVTITKSESKDPKYTTDFDKCERATVCDTTTGDVVTVSKSDAKDPRYVDQNSDKCKDVPEEIPSTGPMEIVSGVAGIGSLAGASSMYFRSRRTLRR